MKEQINMILQGDLKGPSVYSTFTLIYLSVDTHSIAVDSKLLFMINSLPMN